jgi:hypothetical protein
MRHVDHRVAPLVGGIYAGYKFVLIKGVVLLVVLQGIIAPFVQGAESDTKNGHMSLSTSIC